MGVEIIAEIGCNHDGVMTRGIELIQRAKLAGADTVKFQLTDPYRETSGHHAPDHLRMISGLGVDSINMISRFKDMCAEVDIGFLVTPAEEWSLDSLMKLGVDRIKIASDNLTNIPFLKKCGQTGLPLIMSTGMGSLREIEAAVNAVGYTEALERRSLTLLHCTSCYPCAIEDANLMAIPALRQKFNKRVGWSDHTRDLMLASVAVGLGAEMIEKHITYSQSARGPDHSASLEPAMFAIMVDRIRHTEAALGDGEKSIRPCEIEVAKTVRKSIVAAAPIRRGEPFTMANLAVKRPGDGIPPTEIGTLIVHLAARDYEFDEQIDRP